MVENEQLNKILEVVSAMGLVNIKDQESLIDGNSVALLTSKVNAMAIVLLKDKPQEVKNEFIATWKSEYRDLIDRKHGMISKVMDMPGIADAMGVPESAVGEIKEFLMGQVEGMKEYVQTSTESVIRSIDTYEI